MISLLHRWLTRPSRAPRGLRAGLATVLGAISLIGIAAPSSPGQTSTTTGGKGVRGAAGGAAPSGQAFANKLPAPPGPGDPTASFPSSPPLVAEGRALYNSDCSSCHGFALRGRAGIAPSLRDVGPGPVDFYLSTGRMPLEAPRDQPFRNRPLYSRSQIDAIIAYVSMYGGPPAPRVDPAAGDLALGLHAFTLHCAGCHQIVARGGLTLGAVAPALQQATPQQIAEAVRMGPYVMPHFDFRQIDQHQLDSIVRYVGWTRRPDDAGGWGIDNIGPIPEGIVAWFIALTALVIVARLIGERTA